MHQWIQNGLKGLKTKTGRVQGRAGRQGRATRSEASVAAGATAREGLVAKRSSMKVASGLLAKRIAIHLMR